MNKKWMPFIIIGAVILILIVSCSSLTGTYNSLVRGEEGVKAAWSQVENVYQRRADLIPNLVQTVKGYASHEKETLAAVIEARSKATGVNITPEALNDPNAMAKFQQAQAGLSSALSRLMVVVERYPDLKANENFLGLQAQLEGTENRISVERRRYNETVEAYNSKRRMFPTSIIASMFNFKEKAYFKADEGAKEAPKVSFD